MHEDPNNENLDLDLVDALKEIIRQKELEDNYVRKQQIRMWKKNERFWHGIQYIYWSETQQDWIAPINTRANGEVFSENREDAEGPFYDYVINTYRANGESVIAALAAQVPAVRFPPDDAENEDDVATSKTYDRIADLISRHNQSKMILLQTFLLLWNQGLVCAYHSPKADKAYGKIQIPNYDTGYKCDACDSINPSEDDNSSSIKATPDVASEVEGQEAEGQETEHNCPQCGQPMKEIPMLSGFSDAPKTRVIIDLYGPLFVKINYYARTQEETGYLGLKIDQPIELLKSLFPNIADEIDSDSNGFDLYEKIGRSPSTYTYAINDNKNLRTLQRWWLRPYEFECLGKEKEEIKRKLYKLFPDGAYVCMIGDTYAESRNECLDKYWTIGKAGLSQYIHSDPMGQPQISLSEMRNVLTNLTLETIEQGISSVIANPKVLNFKDYARHELRPGATIPGMAPAGTKMGDHFYETPRATLSKEVPMFQASIDKDSQFVTGAFPSIYGGPGEGNSRTAAEYEMSRQNALQRLSICWTMVTHWYAKMIEKCVRLYVECVVADEKYVVKNQNNYVNVWIRQSELTGKVGDVEAEGAETFPVTTGQKQSLLFKLMGLNNELINAALFAVPNRKILADALSFPELEIPDENQRIKQSKESNWMVEKLQYVDIEPDVDDDNIHIETLKDFLTSSVGLDLKISNPEAYGLNIQHLQAHLKNKGPNQVPPELQVKQAEIASKEKIERLRDMTNLLIAEVTSSKDMDKADADRFVDFLKHSLSAQVDQANQEAKNVPPVSTDSNN